MPKEISAGAIVFRRDARGQPLYLLLHYRFQAPAQKARLAPTGRQGKQAKKEYWDFPKGHIEKGETEIETVRREIQEETGVTDLTLVAGFKETISYMFQAKGQKIFKTVVFFLGETHSKGVKISAEHLGYVWLPFEKALLQVKFLNAKKLLKKSQSLISSRLQQSF